MLRAVLIATGETPGLAALCERSPALLSPLLDRPFIQHVVEWCVQQGCRDIDMVLANFPEKIEKLLEDGSRWGARITYHLARDPERPYDRLRVLAFEPANAPVLLGHADRLPPLAWAARGTPCQLPGPILFMGSAPAQGASTEPDANVTAAVDEPWSGWGVVTGPMLRQAPAKSTEADLERHLLGLDHATREPARPVLSVRTYADYLASCQAVLRKEFAGLMVGGVEAEPGVWLSRNVVLHPTARITPPVYLAEDSQIGAGARLGPLVAIGQNCMVDRHANISESVVLPGSYVGEALELEHAIVDRNRLVSVRLDAAISVKDDLILSAVAGGGVFRWVASQLARLAACVLLAVLAPVLLLTVAWRWVRGCRPIFTAQTIIRLPSEIDDAAWRTFTLWSFEDPPKSSLKNGEDSGILLPSGDAAASARPSGRTYWRSAWGVGDSKRKISVHQAAAPTWRSGLADFVLRFVPGLYHVIRGELSFVGLPPRTAEQIRALPDDWRSMYLHAKAGLVTEAYVRYGSLRSEEEQYSAESVYAVTASPWHDARLLIGYLFRVLDVFARVNWYVEEEAGQLETPSPRLAGPGNAAANEV